MSAEIEALAAKLTKAQREAVARAAIMLGVAADAGIGADLNMADGSTIMLSADDIVEDLFSAFGITLEEDTCAPLGLAVRDHLKEQSDDA